MGVAGGRYWLVLVLLVAMLVSVRQAEAGSDETSALLEFFRGVTGVETGGGGCLALTWSSSSAGEGCPASFCGVTCGAEGSVIAVQLGGQGLRGTVRSNSLANLKALSILDLSDNQLSGTLPDDLGTGLANLRTLDLSHNSFSGPIPSTFSGLRSVLNLSLAANQLNGTIPSSLGALQHLMSLNLSSNSLSEGIPLDLSQMESLTVLDLHSNQLSGGIDPALLGLASLARVDLSNNKLSGFLPWQPNDTLPLLRTLQYVNLSYNQLMGPLAPARFASIFAEKLQVLDMSHNQLGGNLPDFEFEIALVTLRLSHNQFTGAIPSTLLSTNLGLLEELDLSNNNLTGEIPRVLSTSLAVLNVSYNSLSGMIPQKIGSCSIVDLSSNELSGDLSYLQYWNEMLEVLDLSFNRLSGGLMDEVVSRFVRVRSLNMSHNGLFGSIPSEFGVFPKLTYLDLSFNHLNGSVPASFFNSSSLSWLVLSNNDLDGNIPLPAMLSFDYPSGTLNRPLQVGQVSQLAFMDLSSNKLDGNISEGIGNLQNLKVVNLSNNQISGPMPKALCSLTNLQGLDLSGNFLTGSIPDALPSTLGVLLLSNNRLSGFIPENLQRFPASSFFPGNSGLVPGWAFSSSSKGPPASSHTEVGIRRALKAGLIGGCTAGLVLFLVVALFVYSRTLIKSEMHGKNSRLSTSSRKGVNICTPCAALFSFCESHTSKARLGTSSSDGLLAERVGKSSMSLQGEVLSMEGKSSWEQALKAEPHDSRMKSMEMSPSRSRHALSPESLLHHESFGVAEDLLHIEESPIVLKVQSPDRLAGDLHFLDNSLRFTAEELSRAPAEVLGRSSHGTTYKATLDNGYLLTVKWLREGLAKNKKEFSREAKKFAKIRHPNLNPLRGYYWGPQEHEKLILSDFASSGSLAAHLADRTAQKYAPLSWQQRLVIAVDVARGLLYLHDDRHLPHGNLKASNVLIDGGNSSARLADYSLHLLMTCQGTANQILNAGALGYRAPELATMKKPKPTMKGDVYALGVLMLELLTGKGAGDIISGQSGAVDLTDWVKLLAHEKRSFECIDPMLLDTTVEPGYALPLAGMEEMICLALKCISHNTLERPSMATISEEISSLSTTTTTTTTTITMA
eukprot:c16142_g1_i1 orf=311-3691(+)